MKSGEQYMQRCLQLAKLGTGNVAPNPMVGAMLLYHDKIIGEGFHSKYGQAHAEVNCINSVKESDKILIKHSVLYVSLEPCAHYGKTPPCTDIILKNKIKKVVVGCRDVYKEVNGKGIQKLENAGVQVVPGVLENKCIELNKRFFTFHKKQRPYIILKWAESNNGKIAAVPHSSPGMRVLISNEYTNRLVHKWRSEEAAILIGTNTALYDDPSLTARLWNTSNPVRLVIDMNLRLPASLQIFNKEVQTIIFNKTLEKSSGNPAFLKLISTDILAEMMHQLYKRNIQSVLVEGGSKLLQSFIDAFLWDEARVIRNEKMVINKGIAAPHLSSHILKKQKKFFGDTISFFTNKENDQEY